MLAFYPVRMFTVHRLPGLVMEPGSSHDLQSLTWPIDGVALPLLQINLVDASANNDEEISLVTNQLGIWSIMSLAMLALSRWQVGREFSPWRMRIVKCSMSTTFRIVVILLGITEVIFITTTAVAISTSLVVSKNKNLITHSSSHILVWCPVKYNIQSFCLLVGSHKQTVWYFATLPYLKSIYISAGNKSKQKKSTLC